MIPVLQCSIAGFSQPPSATITPGKKDILIGEQFQVLLQVQFEPGKYLSAVATAPAMPGHFEWLHTGDAIPQFDGTNLTGLTQQFTLTSFDSGRWYVPAVAIKLQPAQGNKPVVLYSDSIPVTVSFSLSDTTAQLKDIKPVRAAQPETNWWYWMAVLLGLVVLIAAATWLYRRFWTKKINPDALQHSKLSALEEALQALQALQQQAAGSNFQQRLFFTTLPGVLRRYLSRKDMVDYSHTTTGDILLILQDKKINGSIVADAAAALRLADAVKFARYQATKEDCLQSIIQVKQAISSIEENSFNPKT
ncbi:MAG TPA: hypothetical protein PKC39_00370 [Ferruginibacter sp.]|nr:hypothetical protein [Ferruginibacter sp.]HMP19384.1 hypothetical protein [Ferruginibacter sp.]